jgi:hypothetical protein
MSSEQPPPEAAGVTTGEFAWPAAFCVAAKAALGIMEAAPVLLRLAEVVDA